MSARRALAVGALVACLSAWPVATAAAVDEPPGPLDLELMVDRLEQAQQADVVGSATSAMLFAPTDTAAIEVATDARAAARAADVGRFFLASAIPSFPSVSTELLFAPVSTTGAAVPRVVPEDSSAGFPWAPVALGALLVAGSALSYVVRERQEVTDE